MSSPAEMASKVEVCTEQIENQHCQHAGIYTSFPFLLDTVSKPYTMTDIKKRKGKEELAEAHGTHELSLPNLPPWPGPQPLLHWS